MSILKKQNKELRFSFNKDLTVFNAEDAISRLAWERQPSAPLMIDLSACMHLDIGTGSLLGNGLRRYASVPSIKVMVPEPNDSLSDFWFLEYTRSGIAFSLASYATEIHSPSRDITNQIRDYYTKGRSKLPGLIELSEHLWAGQNFCLLKGIDKPIIDFSNLSRFRDMFIGLSKTVSMDPSLYSTTSYNEIIQLVYEGLQNIYDHAGKKPLALNTRILTYLSLKYYKTIKSKSWDKSFDGYLDRIYEYLPTSHKYDGWIELVINDDGVGIAARQSQDPEIYWTDDDKEIETLTAALSSGGSIKLLLQEGVRARDPGYGFAKISDSLRAMGAFLKLRTGRLIAYFDPTLKDSKYEVSGDLLGYMPGTTLQIIIPRRVREPA
ncbi:MAG TPA: hypothetical protein VKS81_03545 [Bacteroidota bacterium]|nr:hypothetical protein [Bacteroidota bacterium]